MRLPGNTRPGSCAIPIEPGTRCERELPWEARFDEKLWRLIEPAKPLPCEVPETSTFWPGWKISALMTDPGLSSATDSPATLNSRTMLPASTPAFAKWPAFGLVTRVARRCP